MKKRKRFLLFLLIPALIVILCLPPFATLRSMAVMSVYSAYCSADSLEKQEGFRLKIPGGMATGERDWYPLVLFYDASEEFSGRTAANTRLNIYYNFPAYSIWEGSSWLYDPDSPYYTGFYGAYAVQSDQVYGFDEQGRIDLEQVAEVLRFDLFDLVLDDFGLNPREEVFEWQAESPRRISYAGRDGWSSVDARVRVNGAGHSPDQFRVSYLQYGYPSETTEEFAPVTLYGRLIGQYFAEWNTSIFFYILAPDRQVLENCDRRILSASRLESAD